MRYMIHAVPERMWYVNKYITPKLEDYYIWEDKDHKGNLTSFIESCKYIVENEPINQGIWHLQDDIWLCSDFLERTKNNEEIVQNGGIFKHWEFGLQDAIGKVSVMNHWWSFQCIYIPNRILRDFYYWFIEHGKATYPKYYEENKNDDFFFYNYLTQISPYEECINIKPNLVDHIDYLIGGSIIKRRTDNHRALYFNEEVGIENVKEEANNK